MYDDQKKKFVLFYSIRTKSKIRRYFVNINTFVSAPYVKYLYNLVSIQLEPLIFMASSTSNS